MGRDERSLILRGSRCHTYTGPSSWRLMSFISLVALLLCHRSLVLCQTTEAYFNGTTIMEIVSNSSHSSGASMLYHVGFSLRTCGPRAQGTLLSQNVSGDLLSLALQPGGNGVELNVSLISSTGNGHSEILSPNLVDNRWHNIDLYFMDGMVRLQVDNISSLLNTSLLASSAFSQLHSKPNDPIFSIIGQGFTGCIHEGPSLRFSQVSGGNALLGACPIPFSRDCGGLGTDPCFLQPCNNNGRCVPTSDGFECHCTKRYVGNLCQHDQGSLCDRLEHICLNDGICREDAIGNQTTCHCTRNFTGSLCENTIDQPQCDVNLCQNNGTCYMSNFGEGGNHECVCPPGFGGLNCETNLDDCEFSPCKNGGICIDGVDSFTCDCHDTGFQGERCEQKTNHCLSNPCQNGGICYDRYGSFICQCQEEFSGNLCEHEMTSRMLDAVSCEIDSCLNGGICNVIAGELQCRCAPGYEGLRCEVDIDDCQNVTCPWDSVCQDEIDSHRCVCKPGYSGTPPNCQEINECASNPCMNEATCTDLNDGYACFCSPGFGGVNCEIDIDNCEGSPCVNGATCVDRTNNYTCICPNGFQGINCEINIDDCAPNPCVHSANCIDLVADYRCDCIPGWTGKNCDVEIDECESSPCLNNGTCVNEANTFVCECPNGFLGDRCEINKDDCNPNFCRNNATCIDGVANYTCVCPSEFMGRHCEEEFDACASSPCQNGASCITTRPQHSFYCECLPGFEGLHCENNIDECFSIQCVDGKQCFDLINGYECRCPIGFTGTMCQENINDCAENPCRNGGSCIDGIGNYTCSCPPGFTGRNCEDDIDECTIIRPCMYGICQNTVGSYQCYCRPGFSGDNCNLEFDECLSHPCLNNGTCNNLINGYECVCAPGFTGKDCDININECESNPCQNNGTCIDGIALYSCICLPGFSGSRCEININECDSSPCLNEGVCIDGINSYECDCTDTGFKGDHCEINVDDCESAPCVHGSQCVDKVKDYFCQCFPGYQGKNCEEDINECDLQLCQNGATCLERSNRTLYDLGIFSNFSYNTSGGYVCRCQPGFEGVNCEIDIDECALTTPKPCKFGTCVDGINNYSCSCNAGYEGDDCELEIDECERHRPCINGNCMDLIADYKCICPANYGGKNCSVELLGCVNITCLHGGTCIPFLEEESIHKFTCQCPFGYHGEVCEHITTMSFNGSAFMPIQTNRDEGYDLLFRFRTTLPNGLLAVGQGQTYYRLELLDGQLNLHSSLLNKWEGVFLGSNLNDAEWQSVHVRFNFSHLLLAVNEQEAAYPINPVESINSTETSFGMTVLGGATSTLRILAQGLPFFIGCMENVVVNGHWVIPSTTPSLATQNALYLPGVGVEIGCPRVDLCRPNPCQNQGVCNDLWTFFNCSCQRPYLGDTCQFSYTAGTFGHENASNSLVSVSITPQERLALSNSMDISMFVRTREETGLIFYLGTTPASATTTTDVSTWPSYIAAELDKGKLLVVVDLGDNEQVFPVQSMSLNDGNSHLVQVIRDRLELRVKINGTLYLNGSLNSFRPLQAEVLYLGGLPQASRLRRQTISPRQIGVGNNLLQGRNFKGILQDIQVKSGNVTRIVEIFPLQTSSIDIPEPLGTVEKNDVLEGVVSDDTCKINPCINGGTCNVTWNDFSCKCPPGFKGKTCQELEFCAIHQCPVGGVCQNLNDGYECLTAATFNGVNSSISYASRGIDRNVSLQTIHFAYRSKQGGTVLLLKKESSRVRFLRLDVENSGVIVRWITNNSLTVNESILEIPGSLDGDWHPVTLNIPTLIGLADFSLSEIVISGQITVGGYADEMRHTISERDVELDGLATTSSSLPTADNSESSSIDAMIVSPLLLPQSMFYRGCLNEVRIGDILLPFFSASELSNDRSARKFEVTSPLNDVEHTCRLCYDHECQNGAFCLDPLTNFTCNCSAGYEGDLCEINIDECATNFCVHGICVDDVANYTCKCNPGWTGWLCDIEINECESQPCQNNGTCTDLIGEYICNCTEDFVGVNCEKPRVVTCVNDPCVNGNCSDIYDPVTNLAINYTCRCAFGFQGMNCDAAIDYCATLQPCENDALCTGVPFEPGYICECQEGFSGDVCQINVNECLQKPCLNGGRCIDGINNFTCDCIGTGYEGYLCEVDIDECKRNDPCVNGRCTNLAGSYNCTCESEDFCGRNCDRKDPCRQDTLCFNGATCIAHCDEIDPLTKGPNYKCNCVEGFDGRNCSLQSEVPFEPNLRLVAIIVPIVAALLLIILIGAVVFVMMARNKRATRGTYSPSRQEMFSPRVEMGQVMKPPPEERLI